MPLVMMCGIPCSGKSRRAEEIRSFLVDAFAKEASSSEGSSKTVEVVNEESLFMVKDEAYRDGHMEKQTRGLLRDAASRHISRECTVILDSMNFIKGFRYEVYCQAREHKTPHCVVFCDTPTEVAEQWNKERSDAGEADSFSERIFADLSSRLEIPDGNARWDKPLFTVGPQDALPLEDILQVVQGQGFRAHTSNATAHGRLEDTTFRYQMDKRTSAVVAAIMTAMGEGFVPGDRVRIPEGKSQILLRNRVSPAELRRLRGQFLRMNTTHPIPVEKMADSFAHFLQQQLDT